MDASCNLEPDDLKDLWESEPASMQPSRTLTLSHAAVAAAAAVVAVLVADDGVGAVLRLC